MCIRDRRFRGYEVETLENDEFGRVTLQELERKMRPNTALISVMHVNNETGAVNPVDDLAALAKRINPRCFFHRDVYKRQGMGIDRLTTIKYGITDIRLLFEGDTRFLAQF